MYIIVPKTYINVRDDPYRIMPLFFLGGPIRGGGDWQTQMCLKLGNRSEGCLIACPCRWDTLHPLAPHFVRGEEGPNKFPRQLNWERHYLNYAGDSAHNGCVIFWIAAQKTPREDGGAYARDTLGEIGEWRGRLMNKPDRIRLVVGVDPKFEDQNGVDVMHRNFELALGKPFLLYTSMDSTATAAVLLARSR